MCRISMPTPPFAHCAPRQCSTFVTPSSCQAAIPHTVQRMPSRMRAGSGYTSDAVECLRWCRNNGAKITSNSWGGGGYLQSMYDEMLTSQV